MNADPSCIGCAMELVLGSPCGLMNNGRWMPMVFLVTRNTWRIDQNTEKNKGNVSNVGKRGSESL